MFSRERIEDASHLPSFLDRRQWHKFQTRSPSVFIHCTVPLLVEFLLSLVVGDFLAGLVGLDCLPGLADLQL